MATSLQLEGYFITKLSFGVKEGKFVPGKHTLHSGIHPQCIEPLEDASFSVQVEVNLSPNKGNPDRWRVKLRLSSAKENNLNPYEFGIVLIGFFRLVEAKTDEDVQIFIGKNAPSILYSAAREALAMVTGRGPFPALVLPAVIFPAQPNLKQGLTKQSARKSAKNLPTKSASEKAEK